MKARHRRILVREPRRLESAIGVGPTGDRVDESHVGQPRGRAGEQREEQEADQTRCDHRVSQQAIPLAAKCEERDGDGGDHRPVPPDVHPVHEVDEHVTTEHERLRAVLPRHAEGTLDPYDVIGIPLGHRRAPLRQLPHSGVGDAEGDDNDHFAGELPRRRTADLGCGTAVVLHTGSVAPRPQAPIQGEHARRLPDSRRHRDARTSCALSQASGATKRRIRSTRCSDSPSAATCSQLSARSRKRRPTTIAASSSSSCLGA